MKHFLTLKNITLPIVKEIFSIADVLADTTKANEHFLDGKSVVMFFPNTSIRTRLAFEKGIAALGGQPILFPSDALGRKEAIEDVVGYLNN